MTRSPSDFPPPEDGRPASETPPLRVAAPPAHPDVVPHELFAAVLRGERFAVDQFGKLVLPLIRGAVHRVLVGSGALTGGLVEDLVQDVFLLLFAEDRAALRKWNPALGRSLRGFLFVFARLRTIDRLRAHAAGFPNTDLMELDDLALLAAADPALFERVALNQTVAELNTRLATALDDRQRQLLELTMLEYSGEEIAAEMKITAANVFQIRRRLRTLLSELYGRVIRDRPTAASKTKQPDEADL